MPIRDFELGSYDLAPEIRRIVDERVKEIWDKKLAEQSAETCTLKELFGWFGIPVSRNSRDYARSAMWRNGIEILTPEKKPMRPNRFRKVEAMLWLTASANLSSGGNNIELLKRIARQEAEDSKPALRIVK